MTQAARSRHLALECSSRKIRYRDRAAACPHRPPPWSCSCNASASRKQARALSTRPAASWASHTLVEVRCPLVCLPGNKERDTDASEPQPSGERRLDRLVLRSMKRFA